MSRNYSKWLMLIILPAWVFVGFSAAQLLLSGLMTVFSLVGISLSWLSPAVLNTSLAALLYLITLLIVIGMPWLIRKSTTTMNDIGLGRLMSWTDILMTPAGLIIYLILSSVLILTATKLLPWFDVNQIQDNGFDQLGQRYEYMLAFITLVIIAPVSEEIIFRGYLYGKLKKFVPVWVSIIATSLLFGAIHGSWNLAVDTFALSIVLCLLREITGSIWSSILLHMTKNGIAFYILFINPLLLATMVR